MDKYSKKIIKFINNNNFKINTINIKNHNIISTILDICKNNLNNNIIPVKNTKIIKKLHEKQEYPQLYYFFKEYKPDIIKTFRDFVIYYSLNQHLIDKTLIEQDIQNNNILFTLFNNIYYPNNDRYEIVNIFYNNFQSIDVIQELETNDLICIEINLEKIKLKIYYYDIYNIDKYIKNIINIIYIIDNIAIKYDISINNYELFIFLGKNKKYLFNKKKIITPMNINSGATLMSSYVCLWRKEEYEKVLIHELLHYIGIDYHLFQNHELNNTIKEIFNIDGINNMNESYNEFVAAIINMCYKSCKYNIDINFIYDIEIKFLIFQTNKIIRFFNGTNANDLYNIQISQTSSALSYIIFKTILFLNIVEILNLIEYTKIKLNTYDKIKLYQNLILKLIIEKKYLDILNNNFNIISSTEKKFIDKTLRMSVI
jgi:hypothetical protein